MSIEFKEAREKFEGSLRDRLKHGDVEKFRQEEIDEIAQEVEEYFDFALTSEDDLREPEDATTFHLPLLDEVISRDSSGEVLSRFGDDSWYLIGKSGIKKGYHFKAKRGEGAAYCDDPQATPLAYLERMMLYAFWPGKNLTQKPYTAASLDHAHKSIRALLSWFHKRGHFLGTSIEGNDHDSDSITAEELRSEITQRMTDGIPLFHLEIFMAGIRLWMRFKVTVWCPNWFRPSLTTKDIFTKRLIKDVSMCIAAKRNRWAAIEFDSLQPLFSTAQNYLEVYCDDIFWLIGRFELASELAFKSSHDANAVRATIASNDRTKNLFNEICGRAYATIPNGDEPWFVPEQSPASPYKNEYGGL